MGSKLATKLWNVARFSDRFISERFISERSLNENGFPSGLDLAGEIETGANAIEFLAPTYRPEFSLADRWILARCQQVIRLASSALDEFDYAAAKNEIELFFWHDLADNYLEMCKQRLYTAGHPQGEGARLALQHVLINVLKLFAPFLPYVTEEIYQGLFAGASQPAGSIHTSAWPVPEALFEDPQALEAGKILIEIASAVRRYKSEHNLPLGSELRRLQLIFAGPEQAEMLADAAADLASICRVAELEAASQMDPQLIPLGWAGSIQLAIQE